MKIIPKEILEKLLPEIDNLIKKSAQNYSSVLNDITFGESYKYFLLFTNWPHLLTEEGIEIDNELIFYSRYYWFIHFLKLYTLKKGMDAGLEQQAFRLLEESERIDVEIDWSFIEKIQRDIEEEIKK